MSNVSNKKNNKPSLYRRAVTTFLKGVTVISPVLNSKLVYRLAFKKKINLKNPTTFIEKLTWLKLYNYRKNKLVHQCADKYRVREYIKDCGCQEILNELIAVYDNPKQIEWDKLPNKFVLKWNYGAGMNIICTDKSSLDIKATVKQLKKWGKVKYWLPVSEMQYKYIPKKIICERFLEPTSNENNSSVIPDYKVYCFNGQPKAIFVMHDRGSVIKTEMFNTEWQPLENSVKYSAPKTKTPKPVFLDKLLEYSKILSKPFPFVRADFYIVDEKIYFGELTFTPAGGMHTSTTKIEGKDMTEFLDVKV